ncbi:hypothetical protein EUGRSUZ_B03057 [Eucalyptus grandis]|uniref:Uncharacterized protein n=2 Tax=Eucalyptus grandis TaxID=71139 RepID=A0ACC3LW02_EUCGR|nr:hypothetical protein EUGRSUZ_B03057 [Eucalyptus grandis]
MTLQLVLIVVGYFPLAQRHIIFYNAESFIPYMALDQCWVHAISRAEYNQCQPTSISRAKIFSTELRTGSPITGKVTKASDRAKSKTTSDNDRQST